MERIERVMKRLEELEEKGVLATITKSLEKLVESFDAIAEPKNMRLVAMVLLLLEGVSKIDPSLVTVLADSMGTCAAKTQRPEVIRQIANPPEIGGLLGLMKILGDPDVKKLLGLLYVYAKIMGSCLPDELRKKASELESLYKIRLEMAKQ